jgi:hypothetical protein
MKRDSLDCHLCERGRDPGSRSFIESAVNNVNFERASRVEISDHRSQHDRERQCVLLVGGTCDN